MKELSKNDEHLIKSALAIKEALYELRQVDKQKAELNVYLEPWFKDFVTVDGEVIDMFKLLWKLECCLTDTESFMTQEARDAFIEFEDRH